MTPPAVGRTLRVLLVTPDYPPAHGGIQRLLHNITSAMPNTEVRVITPQTDGSEAFDNDAGQVVYRVPNPFSRALLRNAAFNASGLLAPRKWRPDVVLNGHVVSGPVAAMIAHRYGVPTVLYTYGKEIAGRPGMAAWSLKRSASAIAVSEYTRDQLRTASGRGIHSPIHVINPGVQIPAPHTADRADRPTILTIARLRDWYKGHDMILEALPRVRAAVPTVRWVVVGDGRIRSELEARARQLGLDDAVEFVGGVGDDLKNELLATSHVFAMPSRYPKNEVGGEGFPVVYLEAAAWGLPAVAGNVGGPAEAVLNEVTGLTVDPESPQEIGDALIRLLSDTEFAARLGRSARERTVAQFTWQAVASQLESVLRLAAGGKK